jgi:hypothetical protein
LLNLWHQDVQVLAQAQSGGNARSGSEHSCASRAARACAGHSSSGLIVLLWLSSEANVIATCGDVGFFLTLSFPIVLGL